MTTAKREVLDVLRHALSDKGTLLTFHKKECRADQVRLGGAESH